MRAKDDVVFIYNIAYAFVVLYFHLVHAAAPMNALLQTRKRRRCEQAALFVSFYTSLLRIDILSSSSGRTTANRHSLWLFYNDRLQDGDRN